MTALGAALRQSPLTELDLSSTAVRSVALAALATALGGGAGSEEEDVPALRSLLLRSNGLDSLEVRLSGFDLRPHFACLGRA